MPVPQPKKIIALYEIAGFGHLKPALALIDQLKKYPVEAEAWDIYADSIGESALEKDSIYNRISTDPLYVKFWNMVTDSRNPITRHLAHPAHLFDLYTKREIMSRIKFATFQNPNTAFFCTHFTPALLAAKTLPHQKVFLYVTDIHPHAIWAIHRKNIIYLVPLEYTRTVLIQYGINPDNIRIVSFPINPLLLNQNAVRHKKRLKNLKREHTTDILIISGGAGTGRIQMENLLNTFAAPAHAHKVNITFLASTVTLRDALKETRVKLGLPKESAVIDTYKPDNLYKAMCQAEILITKSGGDITFEALAEGLPVYTLRDVGDHERINREYMEKVGASRPLEAGEYPWELIHHDILTGRLVDMAKKSYAAGAFHRAANVPRLMFAELGWKLS